MEASRPILLLEDDTLDAMIVRRTLGRIGISNPVIHRINGEEGLEYLQTCSKGWPCLVLLDLNMPRMNGLEFLQRIREDAQLQELNVFILTTSTHRSDISDSFRLGAKGYIVKCIDSEKFAEDLDAVRDYCVESEELETVESGSTQS